MSGKRWLAVAIALVAILTAACDYPDYRGSPAHTGFNAFENSISAANVPTMTEAFSGPVFGIPNSPVVANGVLYVETVNELAAFSAQSTPLVLGVTRAVPTVVDGTVYRRFRGSPRRSERRQRHCLRPNWWGRLRIRREWHRRLLGSTEVCQPLWQDADVDSSPTVVNGFVYADSNGDLVAFDAAGHTNCSGTPKVCQPVWTGTIPPTPANLKTAPAVLNGVVYVAGNQALYAFDAAGKTNCLEHRRSAASCGLRLPEPARPFRTPRRSEMARSTSPMTRPPPSTPSIRQVA